MEREVRYCTAEDGVRIAYSVEGAGTALVLLMNFFPTSFSLMHLIPHYEAFIRDLGEGRQLVHVDMRGSGLSQRAVDDLSFSTLVSDLRAVTDEVGLTGVAICAGGNASQIALAYAAQYSSDVANLILYAPIVRTADSFPRDAIMVLAQLARTDWEGTTRYLPDGELRRKSEEAGLQYAEWLQRSTSGETFARLVEAFADIDVTSLLPKIETPTLIVHRRDDASYAHGQRLAASLPNARFVSLPEGNLFSTDNEPVLKAIDSFLADRAERRRYKTTETAATFRTVLFTDVVQNTALLSQIGDERWRAVMREHEDIVRTALRDHGGTEISTSGDGFFASFASATRALQCAVETQQAQARRNARAEHPVEVRMGLNAGEPIAEGKDLVGTTVTLAARIMGQAGGGEVLVSDVVRQLVAGKGFSFDDRGEFVPKGFDEAVRLFEIRWRD